MAAKECVDCGVTLTGWNSNFIGGRCIDCYRVPYAHAKAFFDRKPISEQELRNWKFSKSIMALLAYAVFLFACLAVGSLVGFGKGGTYLGIIYAFLTTLPAILIFRLLMNISTVHPLDTSRWYNFAFPYTIILFFSFAIGYLGWMPMIAGRLIRAGSSLSHHVLIAPNVTVPAFYLVLLVGVAAAIIGAVLGLLNVARQEARSLDHLLVQYQRWQQGK